MKYYISIWLKNYKEKVVWAWIDQWLHFNTIVISRVKGYYAKIKEYLDFSTRDLKHIYKSLKLYWTKLYADYKAWLKSAKTQTFIQTEQLIFVLLFRKIYSYILNKLVEQLN